jgi:hypothetical protein
MRFYAHAQQLFDRAEQSTVRQAIHRLNTKMILIYIVI